MRLLSGKNTGGPQRGDAMIDIIYNPETKTLAVAYDDWRIDVYREIFIGEDGKIFLIGDNALCNIGVLGDKIRNKLAEDIQCQMIRVNGWSIVKTTPLKRVKAMA